MKKNLPVRLLLFTGNLLRNTIMMLRIILVIVLFTATAYGSNTYSQRVRISLDLRDVPVSDVINAIRQQTDFEFSYETGLDSYILHNVSINVKNETIDNILLEVFKGTDINFKVVDRIILLSRSKIRSSILNHKESQQIRVSGKITDHGTGEPLPGVNIIIKGTTVGTTTDINGDFALDVPNENDVLVISFIGYTSEEIPVNGRNTITVSLIPDITKLEEVVVIGYGTTQKKNVIGAVDQIQSSAIEGRPVANLTQALQGTAANLTIQQRSGNPNDNSLNINIRGISTMNNNNPLLVIDGMITEMESLNKLNPTDIENISVLKDAGSAAIYGSRSSNGVILVTTKKGSRSSTPVIKMSAMGGVEVPRVLYSPVKGYENAILKNQALMNGGSPPFYSPERIRDLQQNGDGEWFLDGILQNAFQQNYNLSISGGTGNTTYMVSAGYYDQESNFAGGYGLKRYNFRTNLTNEYGKVRLSTVMAFNRTMQNAPNASAGTLIVDGGRIPNYYDYKMKADNGKYLLNDVLSQFNPLGILEAGGYQKKDEDNFLGSMNAEYEIIEGLKAKALLGIDLSANHRYIRGPEVLFYASENSTTSASQANQNKTSEDFNEKKYRLNSQFLLDYDRTFNEVHNFTGLLGVSNESYTKQANELKRTLTNALGGFQTGSLTDNDGSYNTPKGTEENGISSMFGRLGYSYSSKYYGQVSFRYDGSSKFAKDYRWGFFPSVSAGWRLSEEGFMNFYRENVGDLKLRGSYGILGNQNIADYSYFTTYDPTTNTYGFNNKVVAGMGYDLGNIELQWERSANLNVGFDATFLQGKLFTSFDYFNKITSDILLEPEIPTVFGGGSFKDNVGEMKNYGWELTLSYNATTGNFKHNVSFNIADSQNEVINFDGKEEIKTSDQLLRITREGEAFRSYFGYKTDGLFQSYDEIENSPLPIGTTVVPGDVRYLDSNNDGVIDEKDRRVMGNAFPRYTFGLTYNLNWKGFDMGFLIQGVGKRDMFLRGELIEPFHSNYSYVMYTHQLDFWTPVNTDARWPRLAASGTSSNTNNYQRASDIYLLDAAYLRLKNIQLGYTFPKKLITKAGMQNVRFNVNAQNLFTLTKNSFIDPESTEFNADMSNDGANSGRNYPTLVYYGCGLDIEF